MIQKMPEMHQERYKCAFFFRLGGRQLEKSGWKMYISAVM